MSVNRYQKTESCRSCIYVIHFPLRFEFIQYATEAVEVFALAARNDSILRWRQRCNLVNQDRDGTLSSGYQLRVAGDNKAQSCTSVGDVTGGWSHRHIRLLDYADYHSQ